MKDIDWRSETFDGIRARVDSMRERVWRELRAHGPCTTMELAVRAGMSVLNVRPRCTELEQLGFAVVDGHDRVRGGHIYRALTEDEAREFFSQQQRDHRETQLSFL